MKETKFEIRPLTEKSQLRAYVDRDGSDWLVSVYHFSRTWAAKGRKKWQRRLQGNLEAVLTSYHAKAGVQHPAIHEVLSMAWAKEIDVEAAGTLVVFIEPKRLSWWIEPKLSVQQSVLARTFHVKPLLAVADDEKKSPFPDELARSFARLKARGLATDHLPTAAKWVAQGRGMAMFASARREVWGEVNPVSGEVRVLPRSGGLGADDILDDLVEKAWSQGASCWVIEDDRMPSSSPIAVFRS